MYPILIQIEIPSPTNSSTHLKKKWSNIIDSPFWFFADKDTRASFPTYPHTNDTGAFGYQDWSIELRSDETCVTSKGVRIKATLGAYFTQGKEGFQIRDTKSRQLVIDILKDIGFEEV